MVSAWLGEGGGPIRSPVFATSAAPSAAATAVLPPQYPAAAGLAPQWPAATAGLSPQYPCPLLLLLA